MKKLIKDIFIKQILEYLANEEYRSLIIRDKNKRNLAETSFVHLIRWYPQINEEGRSSRQLRLVWGRGSGLHEDGDVCRDGYTAASAIEEPKAGSR